MCGCMEFYKMNIRCNCLKCKGKKIKDIQDEYAEDLVAHGG